MVFPIVIGLAASLPLLGLLACSLFDERTIRMMEAAGATKQRASERAHAHQTEFWYGYRARERFSLLSSRLTVAE
jgi:hypothetical protein